jgi:hypothetical protein
VPAGPSLLFTGWAGQPIPAGASALLSLLGLLASFPPGWASQLSPRLGRSVSSPDGPGSLFSWLGRSLGSLAGPPPHFARPLRPGGPASPAAWLAHPGISSPGRPRPQPGPDLQAVASPAGPDHGSRGSGLAGITSLGPLFWHCSGWARPGFSGPGRITPW